MDTSALSDGAVEADRPGFADGEARPVEESEPCPECGRVFSAEAGAWPTADMKLRAHRARSHGLAKPPRGRARRRRATPVEVAVKATPDMSPPGGSKAPTAREWREALGEAISQLSRIPASQAARSDPVVHAAFPAAEWPAVYAEIEAKLSLSQQDAETLVAPVARRIAASAWNAKRGRAIIANRDLIPAVGVIVSLAAQWRTYLADRAEATRRLEAARAQQAAPQAPTVPLPSTNGSGAGALPADYPFRVED